VFFAFEFCVFKHNYSDQQLGLIGARGKALANCVPN
jgi:hypothetical protein